MNRFIKLLIFSAVAVTVVGVGIAAAAGSDPNAQAVERNNVVWNASSHWSGNGSAATSDQLALVQGLAASYDDEPLAAASSSHVRFPVGDISVVATRKGGICFRASHGPTTGRGAMCAPHFNPNGTLTIYIMETGKRSELVGLVADDVTEVSVTLGDGTVQSVPVTHGALMWTAPHGHEAVTITTKRDGKVVEQTI